MKEVKAMIYKQDTQEHLDAMIDLVQEYMQELNRDLKFQDIQQELNDLSHKYLPPYGHIIMAFDNHQAIGCIALHKHSDTRCEMKRLFVKKEYRAHKIGYELIQRLLILAKQDDYQEMVLDTIEPLKSAIHLYHQIGFYEIDAYYDNPMNDVIYMKKDLI